MAAPNYQADLRSGLHGVQVSWVVADSNATLNASYSKYATLMVGGRRDCLQPCDPGREDGPRGVPRGHGRGDVQDEVRGGRRQQQRQPGVQAGGSL